MLTTGSRQAVSTLIGSVTGGNGVIHSIHPLGGGSINHAYRIDTEAGRFFIKTNSASRYPGMFEAEAKGLEILRQAGGPQVPKVIGAGNAENESFLVLEYLEPGKRKHNAVEELGQKLAVMHRNQSAVFGLDHDNYIGSLNQSNSQNENGIDFMVEQRLRPLAKRAQQAGHLNSDDLRLLEQLYFRLPDLLPKEKPSLLHGDLWNGNCITGPDGALWLLDPAVYYGYRETDLAMAKLFGGFDAAFYKAYDEVFPLAPGWQERTPLFQLYPLLVHVNLFGSGYVSDTRIVLRMFS